MKRKEDATQTVRVRSPAELDALVGKYLTGETPCVHWINSNTDFWFDSVEEAVEAVNDPFFHQFTKPDGTKDSTPTVLTEVRVFRRYSTELTIAWELVAYLTHGLEPLLVRREGETWESAFGDREFISAPTAPIAICLAALRTRGVEVECLLETPVEKPAEGLPEAKVGSLYSR